MPTIKIRKTDFTAGEWSPTLEGRVDLERYPRSCRRLENFYLLSHGAASRRPGTRWKARAAGSGLCLVVKFEFSRTDAYTLELTAGKIRFYRNGVRVETSPGVPLEVVTTYAEAELRELDFAQSNDVLLITHGLHPMASLSRYATTLWKLRDIVFDVMPSFEYGSRPNATVTPSALSGVGLTFTASAAAFEASDVGRKIEIVGGTNIGAVGLITAYTGQTIVTVTVLASDAFTDLAPNAKGTWRLTGSPLTAITPSVKDPVGATVTITSAAAAFRTNGSDTDIGKFLHLNDGTIEITGFATASSITGKIRAVLSSVVAAQSDVWTLEEPAFSPANGYPAKLTFYDNRLYLARTTAQPVQVWGSKSADFFNFSLGNLADDALDFPITADGLNSIEWIMGTKVLLVGTTSGNYALDPGLGNTLTPSNLPLKAATSYAGASSPKPARVSNILLFLTRSRRKLRELVFSFEVDNYVAPDLLLLAEHLTKPLRIKGVSSGRSIVSTAYQQEPNSILWAVREDGTLLGLTYLRDQNVVGWHRHITGPGQLEPDGFLYPQLNDGFCESVAVVPNPDGTGEQVWIAVRRTIAGQVLRYVEMLDDTGHYYESLHTDATLTFDGTVTTATLTPGATTGLGVIFTASASVFAAGDVGKELRIIGSGSRAKITAFNGTAQVTADVLIDFPSVAPIAAGTWGLAAFAFTGLDHLEGRTVDVVVDGAAIAPLVITAGALTPPLTYAGIKVEIGLNYVSTLVTERPEVANLGTIQGAKQRLAKVFLRFYKTLGAFVNGQELQFRSAGMPMGAPVPLFSGDKEVENLGDGSSDPRLTIEQRQPLPMTVLLVAARLSVEDE